MSPSNKYHIIEQIGGVKKRKFAQVYLCVNKESGEYVILKSLEKSPSNVHIQDRLRTEASFNFHLTGLPRTLDLFETENEILLFKSFHVGISLSDYIGQFRGRERVAQLFEVLKQLEPILNHIHTQKIYHLDIKPSNIIIDSSQKKLSVSLIDFGLSMNKTHYEARDVLFPLGYAAPELLLNHLELVDNRTDYFALGITCWKCIQERMPLIHENPSITTNLQLTHPLPDLDSRYKSLNGVLQKMAFKHSFLSPPNTMKKEDVEKALNDALNLRYSNYHDFLCDFEENMHKVKRFLWF